MAEIVNLREFRKKKEKEAKSEKAARNRAVSGRTKGEKLREKDATDRAKTELDAKKLEELEATDDPDTGGKG